MKTNAAGNETQKAYHRRRLEELKNSRTPWENQWRELAEYVAPERLRLTSQNDWLKSRAKIIDNSATMAWRTLASGMHSGITSPARPWFRLTTFDPEMKDYGPAKTYLASVEKRMREVFQSSNLYTAFHTGYGDLGLFGQSAGLLVEDEQEGLRMQQFLHGRFWLARDETGRATVLYRQFRWNVERIVRRFGLKNISTQVRQAYDNAKYDMMFDIYHAVEQRIDRDPKNPSKAHKPWLSNYWEEGGGDPNKMLEESGFDENPIIAPAWEIAGDDYYAVSPGSVALGDTKMLQIEQQRKLEAIDKMVRPPMTGPSSMRNNPASLLPGSITYVDSPDQRGGYRPAMEVNLRIAELTQDIRETRERIQQSFYADLFLMISNMEGIQPRNQFEIAERKEEKLLALGPVLENIYNDQLEPTIERAFAILNRRDELPPPPPELEDQDLKIEYISMLAQAQKAVATGGIERLWSFAGNLAAVKPQILDKLDADETIDIYGEMLGVDPAVIVADEKVKEKRDADAQRQQQAENAEMMSQMAPAAKAGADAAAVLSEAAARPSGGALLPSLGIG